MVSFKTPNPHPPGGAVLGDTGREGGREDEGRSKGAGREEGGMREEKRREGREGGGEARGRTKVGVMGLEGMKLV